MDNLHKITPSKDITYDGVFHSLRFTSLSKNVHYYVELAEIPELCLDEQGSVLFKLEDNLLTMMSLRYNDKVHSFEDDPYEIPPDREMTELTQNGLSCAVLKIRIDKQCVVSVHNATRRLRDVRVSILQIPPCSINNDPPSSVVRSINKQDQLHSTNRHNRNIVWQIMLYCRNCILSLKCLLILSMVLYGVLIMYCYFI